MPTRERSRQRNAEIEAAHSLDDPFAAAVRQARTSITITDPREPDNPLVYVNAAFSEVTGYAREAVIGRNCRFLQGPETDPITVAKLKAALGAGASTHVELLNYRNDGTPFWNSLFISPVRDADGTLVFFFGTQVDVTASKALARNLQDANEALAASLAQQQLLLREVDHRVKNNLQLVASLLHLQSRPVRDPFVRAMIDGMIARIAAIGSLHTRLYQSPEFERVDLGAYANDLAHEVLVAAGRHDTVRLELACHEPRPIMSAQNAAALGLIINELVTNAVKHGLRDGRAGRILLTLAPSIDGRGLSLSIEDDGVGLSQAVSETQNLTGFGSELIAMLARQLAGTVVWEESRPGTRVRLTLPELA